MLIQSIHYTFDRSVADEAAGILKELRDLSRQEPGIIRFEVARSKDGADVFALWEEYRDETALRAHAETEHFARLVVNGIRRLAKERVAATGFPLE